MNSIPHLSALTTSRPLSWVMACVAKAGSAVVELGLLALVVPIVILAWFIIALAEGLNEYRRTKGGDGE